MDMQKHREAGNELMGDRKKLPEKKGPGLSPKEPGARGRKQG